MIIRSMKCFVYVEYLVLYPLQTVISFVVWTHFHMLGRLRHVNLYIWEFHVLQWLVQYMRTTSVLVFLAKLVRNSLQYLFDVEYVV